MIQNFIENGFIIEKEALLFFEKIPFIAEEIAGLVSKISSSKILTKQVLVTNMIRINSALSKILENAKEEEKKEIENAISFLSALSIIKKTDENKKIDSTREICEGMHEIRIKDLRIIDNAIESKKISVKDFVSFFRDRFERTKAILQEKVSDVISIGKISKTKQKANIIGMVTVKRITKNNNIMLELEDMTGKIKIVVSNSKKELFKIAKEIVEDEVIAMECAGNSEILFANNIIFPDIIGVRRRAEGEIAFIADLHIGSKKFLEENFLKFLEWINKQEIKYLFVLGDIIDGVGVYPRQEEELEITDVSKQFEKAAELFSKLRKDINIIFLPGNHDALRIAEPQPHLDEEIASSLYKLENAIFIGNPCSLLIGEMRILLYHGFSLDYYLNNVDLLRTAHANQRPELIINFLLKKRNLAPSYSSTQCFPSSHDALFIDNVDVVATAHMHKSSSSIYNNIITICCSCFQSKTENQERYGHEPDPCKVPVLDMKTGKVRVYDFS